MEDAKSLEINITSNSRLVRETKIHDSKNGVKNTKKITNPEMINPCVPPPPSDKLRTAKQSLTERAQKLLLQSGRY